LGQSFSHALPAFFGLQESIFALANQYPHTHPDARRQAPLRGLVRRHANPCWQLKTFTSLQLSSGKPAMKALHLEDKS
jgi:hypothetical protein